jgi:hypothetical protein
MGQDHQVFGTQAEKTNLVTCLANGLYGYAWARYHLSGMKTLEEVEADVRMLPLEKQEELRDWLENLLEDQLELTDEFKAKIDRGERDIQEGRVQIRKP